MARGNEITVKVGEKELGLKFNTLAEMYYSETLRKKGLGPYEQLQPIEQEIIIIWVGLKTYGFKQNDLPDDFSEYDCALLLDSISLEDTDRIKDAADEGMLFTMASMRRQMMKLEAAKQALEGHIAGKTTTNTKKIGSK